MSRRQQSTARLAGLMAATALLTGCGSGGLVGDLNLGRLQLALGDITRVNLRLPIDLVEIDGSGEEPDALVLEGDRNIVDMIAFDQEGGELRGYALTPERLEPRIPLALRMSASSFEELIFSGPSDAEARIDLRDIRRDRVLMRLESPSVRATISGQTLELIVWQQGRLNLDAMALAADRVAVTANGVSELSLCVSALIDFSVTTRINAQREGDGVVELTYSSFSFSGEPPIEGMTLLGPGRLGLSWFTPTYVPDLCDRWILERQEEMFQARDAQRQREND